MTKEEFWENWGPHESESPKEESAFKADLDFLLLQAATEARNEAYERAAGVADGYGQETRGKVLARAIRSLKSKGVNP